jgi:hypothetical protein
MSIMDQFEQDYFEDGSPDIVNELPGTLYAYRVTRYPDPAVIDWDRWKEFCMEVYGEEREFFLPSQRKVWRSRTSASDRVKAVRSWGGDAELVECTPTWETVADANLRRRIERDRKRIDKLQAKIDEIQERAS